MQVFRTPSWSGAVFCSALRPFCRICGAPKSPAAAGSPLSPLCFKAMSAGSSESELCVFLGNYSLDYCLMGVFAPGTAFAFCLFSLMLRLSNYCHFVVTLTRCLPPVTFHWGSRGWGPSPVPYEPCDKPKMELPVKSSNIFGRVCPRWFKPISLWHQIKTAIGPTIEDAQELSHQFENQ